MTTLRMAGTLLKASDDDRVKTYLLAPFGEMGRTNLGKVRLTASSITVPDDVTNLVINVEHQPTQPVGKFARVEATKAGYEADVRFLATKAGDDALAEVNEHVRLGISVEVDEPVIRNGELLAGTLSGAAVCVQPAFPSAQLVAADAGSLPDGFPEFSLPSETTTESTEEVVVNGVTYVVTRTATSKTEVTPKDPTASTQEQTVTQTTDTAPLEPLAASLPRSLTKTTTRDKETPLFAALAGADQSGREVLKARLNAALDQAISTDLAPTMVKQWLGEVGAKTTYVRRYASLINHDNLTGKQAIGWKFTTGKTPTVGDYPGFPTQPTSTEVKTEAVTLDAAIIAGAGEVDRAWIDFPVPEFWAGFYRECSNDYERKLDAKALAAIVTGATPVVGGTIAAGVSAAAAYIVDGALAVLAAERDLPTFALVGSDLYRDLLLTRAQDLLAFLTGALGLQEGDLAGFTIRPSAAASLTSKVLVGAKAAATLYELPGASPVRVDTVNVANGGVQTGVFGYHAELINDALSLALVAAAV